MTTAPGWTAPPADVAVLLAAAADLEATRDDHDAYLLPGDAAVALAQILRWAAGQHTRRAVTREALHLAELLVVDEEDV